MKEELFGTMQGTPFGGTALESEARRGGQYEKLQKTLQEKNDEKAWQHAMQNQGIGAVASGLRGLPHQNIFAARPQQMYPNPNTVPELQMSLEVAYNMWLVRFGDMWVKAEDVQDADGFRWEQIAVRLRDLRLMEHLSNTGHHRLVPHVWK